MAENNISDEISGEVSEHPDVDAVTRSPSNPDEATSDGIDAIQRKARTATPEGENSDGETAAETEKADAEPGEAPEPEKPKRSRAKERIHKLTQRNREQEAQMAALRQQLADYEAGSEAQEPEQEDYDDLNQFVTDRVAWELAQREKQNEPAGNSDVPVPLVDMDAYTSSAEDARERYADYDATVTSLSFSFPAHVARAVFSGSDDPAEVVYQLAKNPDLAKRLAETGDPYQLGREVAKFEASIDAPKAPKVPAKPAKSAPPATIEPLDGRGTGNAPVTASDASYVQRRMDQLAKKRASY